MICLPFTLFLLDRSGRLIKTQIAFDKRELNSIAAALCEEAGIEPFILADRSTAIRIPNPVARLAISKAPSEGEAAGPTILCNARPASFAHRTRRRRDPYEYCMQGFGDPLPVVPPTVERVERMLAATPLAPDEVIALIPPNYGAATVEKIAANAVMAGCAPEMMRVLIPLVRAACDERFNIHGVQATTHFAAPLVIVNGADPTRAWLCIRQQRVQQRRASQQHARPRASVDTDQSGRRASGRDRHVHAWQSGQVLLLHCRERRAEPVGAAARRTWDFSRSKAR